MSYNCDADIPLDKLNKEQKIELYNLLLGYRPDSEGELDSNGDVVELPYGFSDDCYGALVDFISIHKLTIDIEWNSEDDDSQILSFLSGNLVEDEDD